MIFCNKVGTEVDHNQSWHMDKSPQKGGTERLM